MCKALALGGALILTVCSSVTSYSLRGHRCRRYRPLHRLKRARKRARQMWNQSSMSSRMTGKNLTMVRLKPQLGKFITDFSVSDNVLEFHTSRIHSNQLKDLTIWYVSICFPTGAWETKVSNREKKQQRRKEKGPEDSESPGRVGAPKTSTEAPAAPANTKKNRNHGIQHPDVQS